MEKILQLNEFFVEGGNQENSHVLLHITEPSNAEELAKGYFFAICEINNADPAYLAGLQDIIDQIENNYYENEDSEDKTAFEKTLEKINHQSHVLDNPNVKLHCTIGVIRPPEIIFAYSGKPLVNLFYLNKQRMFQGMDLIGNEESTDSIGKQIFSQIVQGKITSNDFMFIGTPHVGNYFSRDRLQKIISSRPTRQSAEHIERILRDFKEGYSFGGLIIHLQEKEETPQRPAHGDSAKSLTGLMDTERNTAATLSPSLFPRLGNRQKADNDSANISQPKRSTNEINAQHALPHRSSKFTREEPWGANTVTTGKNILFTFFKYLFLSFKWIGIFVYSIIRIIFKNLGLLFLVVTNIRGRRQLILDEWRRSWRSRRENFRHLPIMTKIMFGFSILLVLAFLVSIIYLRAHQSATAARESFENTLQQVTAKKDLIETYIIYKNETAGLSEYQQAVQLLAGLNCADRKEYLARCTELSKQLEEQASKIRKVQITKPELMVDWSQDKSYVPAGIVKLDGRILAYSASSSEILTFNYLTKETKRLSTNSIAKGFTEATVPKENDYALFVFDNSKLLKLENKDDSTSIADVSYPHDNPSLAGILIYNRRLYSLDINNNQILRHDSIKTGFGPGKDWVKGTANLRDSSDITTDGDLFVIKINGTIAKFTAGEEKPFAIQGLDPILSTSGRIWTYTDNDAIYILDSANRRLIVLDKEGRLTRQITATEFSNPIGLAIDPSGYAFILDNGRLFRIDLR